MPIFPLRARTLALVLAAFLPAACDAIEGVSAEPPTQEPAVMRWDSVPQGPIWTASALAALTDHGASLSEITPKDIADWCPGYESASLDDRAAFWVGLLSTLSKHESTWNPRAVGGGGRWFGLVQIAPATARAYGCNAKTGEALKNGSANLSCAIRIMSTTVARDQVISAGMRGVAADWGPFHSTKKREDMRSWTNAQPYCAAKS